MCINHYVTHLFLGCCACETPSNRCWSQPYVGKAGRESCFSLPCCCADFGSAGRVDQWNGKPMPLEVSMMCCLTAALDISGNFSCMTVLWCFKLCLWWCVHTVEQGNKEAKQFYCSELTNPNVGISKIKKPPAGLEANLSKLYVDHMEWPSSCDRTMGAAGSPCAGNEWDRWIDRWIIR